MAETPKRLLHINAQEEVLVLTLAIEQVEGDTVSLDLQQEFLSAVQSAGTRKVVVDFQNVRYISSAAFSPLLALRKLLTGMQGRLIVCGLNKMVGDIFYTTKMADPEGKLTAPFEMRSNVPEAVTAMNQA